MNKKFRKLALAALIAGAATVFAATSHSQGGGPGRQLHLLQQRLPHDGRGQRGKDCCNNVISWGTTSSFYQSAAAASSASPPPR